MDNTASDSVSALFTAISMEISQRELPQGNGYFDIIADPVPVCHFCFVFYTDDLCNRAGRPKTCSEYPLFSLDRHVCHDRKYSCVQGAEAAYRIFFRRQFAGSDRTGFFLSGDLIEYGKTQKMFLPKHFQKSIYACSIKFCPFIFQKIM